MIRFHRDDAIGVARLTAAVDWIDATDEVIATLREHNPMALAEASRTVTATKAVSFDAQVRDGYNVVDEFEMLVLRLAAQIAEELWLEGPPVPTERERSIFD